MRLQIELDIGASTRTTRIHEDLPFESSQIHAFYSNRPLLPLI